MVLLQSLCVSYALSCYRKMQPQQRILCDLLDSLIVDEAWKEKLANALIALIPNATAAKSGTSSASTSTSRRALMARITPRLRKNRNGWERSPARCRR